MPEDVPLDAFVEDGTESEEADAADAADGAGQDEDGEAGDEPEAATKPTEPGEEAMTEEPTGSAGETAEDPRPVSPAAVEPARPTASYDPAGRTCPGCGTAVRRSWHPDTDTETETDADEGAAPDGPLCRDCVRW